MAHSRSVLRSGLAVMFVLPMLFSLPPCPAHGQQTSDNLVINGGFDLDADGDEFPDGWSKREGASLAREAANTWLVLDGGNISLGQHVKLKPGWWRLKLTMRMRVTVLGARDNGRLNISARGMNMTYDFARLSERDVKNLASELGM